LWHAARAERVGQRAPDDLVHERLIAEAYLRFRRVHVDVERVRRHVQEQVHFRAAFLDRSDAVGGDDRMRDRPILDDPAVDEEVLRPACRTLLGERCHISVQHDPAGLLVHLQQVIPIAVQLIEPVPQHGHRRTLDDAPPAARQGESDVRVGQGELRRHPRDLRRLGGVGFQELPPRRQVVEEVVDLDYGSFGRGNFGGRGDEPAVDMDLGSGVPASRAAAQHEMRHGGNRGQRFATKPERQNRRQVFRAPDLARRVPLDCERGVVRLHSLAVVLYANALLSTELDVNHDPVRAGVDRVFNQLLDDRRRTLDDLAGGNLVGEVRGEAGDSAHVRSSGGRGTRPACPRSPRQ
jgi:hypothetical protein